MAGSGDPVPRGRVRRTMPLAGFTARAAGGRLVAGLREKAGDAGAVSGFTSAPPSGMPSCWGTPRAC